jgi:hypothetical protein
MVRVIGRDGPLDGAVLDGVEWRAGQDGPAPVASGQVEAGLRADGTGRVAMRHSGHRDGTVIVYTRAEWEAFVAGAKDGEFDFDRGVPR